MLIGIGLAFGPAILLVIIPQLFGIGGKQLIAAFVFKVSDGLLAGR